MHRNFVLGGIGAIAFERVRHRHRSLSHRFLLGRARQLDRLPEVAARLAVLSREIERDAKLVVCRKRARRDLLRLPIDRERFFRLALAHLLLALPQQISRRILNRLRGRTDRSGREQGGGHDPAQHERRHRPGIIVCRRGAGRPFRGHMRGAMR